MDDYTMLVYDCGCKYSLDENRKVRSISLCNAHYSIVKMDENKRNLHQKKSKLEVKSN